MSATMALLKSKNKQAAPAADATDQELAGSENSGTEEAEAPEEAEAAEEAQDEAEAAEAADEASEDQAAEPEAGGVAIPTSKTEVHQLKMAELPGVHAAMGSPINGFDDLDLKGKKQALLDYLFPKGGKAKSAVAGSDTLTVISSEIEQLKTRAEVETRLQDIIKVEGENFFRKGGLLVKLSEIGDFGEHGNLQEYILANGIAKDYRTARYWMSIYTGLLEAGIPYSDVEEIGWTKLVVLLPVLTKDNVAEWKAKALAMNVATLQATVDAAQSDGTGTPAASSSNTGEIKSMVFKFHKDQTDTANDALAKAKKVAGTESKEVAADLIFTEYLANAPNKSKTKAEPAPEPTGPVAIEFDADTLDPSQVEAFFRAIAEKYPDPKEAMGFLFSGPEDQDVPEGEDEKSYFELVWPTVNIDLNIP